MVYWCVHTHFNRAWVQSPSSIARHFALQQVDLFTLLLSTQVHKWRPCQMPSICYIFCNWYSYVWLSKECSLGSDIEHFNPKRARGGGGIRPPSTFRAIISRNFFFRAASFHDFFLWSFAQLLALFSEKSGIRFESYATLCNRASAQNLKIFWICVQNI